MIEGSGESPIIIKKVHKGHGGHHGGAWKVAYADFVTAMMALFIVLWILGQSAEVKEAVSSYFKDPVGFSNKSKSLINGKGVGPSPMPGSSVADQATLIEAEKAELKKMADKIEEDLNRDTELSQFSDQISFEMVKEGLKIELTDNANDIFFAIGTSELKTSAKKLIEKIGVEVSKLPNQIIVEGHTDSHQFQNSGTGFTNFELSAERALSAKRALVTGGLQEKQIDEIHGYADKRLRDPSDPFSFVNRRISITLKFNEKK